MKLNKADIGNRIHDLRISKNISMEKLADIVGVSGKSTVNEWEKGRSLPNEDSLQLMASYFSVEKNYILYGNRRTYLKNYLLDATETDSEINDFIWKYIDQTTDTNGALAAIGSDPKSFNATTEKKQHDIYDSVVESAIETAVDKNIPDILEKLGNSFDYNDYELINKTSCNVISFNTRKDYDTFEGRIRRLTHEMDAVYSYDFFNDATLEDFLANLGNSDFFKDWPLDKLIEKYYSGKLSEMVMNFSQNISELRYEYLKKLDEYSKNDNDNEKTNKNKNS